MGVVENNIYKTVLNIVCRVTGIDEHKLFKSNKEECVDARCILVNKLSLIGFTESKIVYFTGLTQQCINKLKNSFSERRNRFSITINSQQIDNELTTYNLLHNEL